MAHVNHFSKGYTTTSRTSNDSFPRTRSSWTNTGQGGPNSHEAQSFFPQYLQRSRNVIDSVAPFSDWDKTALNLSLPQGKCHNQCLRNMLQWESASRPWFMSTRRAEVALHTQLPTPPFSSWVLLSLQLGHLGGSSDTTWFTSLPSKPQSLPGIKFNTYTRLQTVFVQELIHSRFEVFAAGAASAIAVQSATAHKSSFFRLFQASTHWPHCQISGHNYRVDARPASFQERKNKKLKL